MNARVMVGDPKSKPDPIHGAGHIEVAEDEIDHRPGDEDRDSLRRISRFDDLVPGRSQKVCHRAADKNLVFDNQNYGSSGCFLYR